MTTNVAALSSALYFIASDLSDLDTLLASLPPEADVHLLDPEVDGLAQILAALEGRTGLGAIQVVTHGAPGRVDLGSLTLDGAALEARAEDLAALGEHLNAKTAIFCSTAVTSPPATPAPHSSRAWPN
jgi:large repetitive protein